MSGANRQGDGIPKSALYLGIGGLLPMGFSSGLMWLPSNAALSTEILIFYAAIILSFMGAIHWGIALSLPRGQQSTQLCLSVIAPLYGWVILITPLTSPLTLAALWLGFVGVYGLDRRAHRRSLMPNWYLRLRLGLTLAVSLCLANATMAALSAS